MRFHDLKEDPESVDILVVKGVELLIGELESDGPTDGFMSVTIALLFFFTVYVLEMIGKGIWFKPWIRGLLGDYAYPVSPCTKERGNYTLAQG